MCTIYKDFAVFEYSSPNPILVISDNRQVNQSCLGETLENCRNQLNFP